MTPPHKDHHQSSTSNNSNILLLTGRENLSCEQIIKKLNNTIDLNISYEEISRDGLKKYLYSLIERKQMNGENEEDSFLIKESVNHIYMNTFLDLLDWIKTCENEVSDDLEKVIGRPVENIDVGDPETFCPGGPRKLVIQLLEEDDYDYEFENQTKLEVMKRW
nr:15954_t:CDS:2 [Entrophospora candida]